MQCMMAKGEHVVYQCPYCDQYQGRKRAVDRHIAREHEVVEHSRCQRCLVAAPKTDGDQAAVPSSQPKRRKVDDGAYFT